MHVWPLKGKLINQTILLIKVDISDRKGLVRIPQFIHDKQTSRKQLQTMIILIAMSYAHKYSAN